MDFINDFSFNLYGAFQSFLDQLQIIFVNLALSGDNALLIALATRGLPRQDAWRAMMLGTAGAIFIRVAMGMVAFSILQIAFLKIVAGLLLIWIAVQLVLEDGAANGGGSKMPSWQGILGIALTIIVADAVMSLDNVVAIASIANGSTVELVIGLGLSIPILVWGSSLLHRFLEDNRFLIVASGVYLGWLAGSIMISDPWVAGWIASDAFALTLTVPLACALFVLALYVLLSAAPAAMMLNPDEKTQ